MHAADNTLSNQLFTCWLFTVNSYRCCSNLWNVLLLECINYLIRFNSWNELFLNFNKRSNQWNASEESTVAMPFQGSKQKSSQLAALQIHS